ncbi:hypothetical protein AVEN_120255-1 [Araneus ventricosus]|uniref:RNA-directed DNA polymerase n=1 Tax=Araneus ventricosus TaxID=182803 RepID=A0A4Y2ERV8_ARAVE|nr:hypothetical protein AVEN_120255-1 [Araneus ventricosus]
MPETGPLTRSMDKQFEKLFAMMAEMKAGQEEMRVAQAGLEQKMEAGQEEMRSGQERMEKGQEEMKGLIDEVKGEVQRKIDEVEAKVQMKVEDVKSEVKGKIEEVEHKVQGKIGEIERRLSELEDRPFSFSASREFMHPRPSIKSLTFDGHTSWTVFKTQFNVVSSTNGWTDFVKASQLVASLRGSAAEISIHARSMETDDDTWKERDDKFESLLKALEKLVESLAAEQNAPRRNPNLTCWKCFKEGHVQRACQVNDVHSRKLTCGRLAERKIPTLNKSPEEELKVSTLSGGENGLYLKGSICDIPCLFLVDTGTNITLLRADLAHKVKERLIYTAPNLTLKTATGEKAKIQGKLDASIECGSRKFQHRVYVADITDSCILGLDFLQKFKFTVDLEKNEIRTGSEKISLFSGSTQHRKRTSDGKNVQSRRLCFEGCEPCSNAEKKSRTETDISVEALPMATENRWSLSEIQKAQLEDPDIRPILKMKLNSADRPSWQEIAHASPATKRYWALWNSLYLKDGVLYRKWESNDGGFYRRQLILPNCRIQEVLRETHDNTSGRHFGVMKTLRKTRERFYWDRLRADVEKWCWECQACGARKGPKTKQGKSVSGRTPAETFSDRTLRFPCDILFGRPRDTPSSPTNSEARLESVQASVGEPVVLSRERMKIRYDFRATDHHFKEGDLVWMYNQKRRRGLSPKLQQNWEGPYTVVKKLNDVVYRVQRSPNFKPKVIHINRLAPCRATDHSSM